MQRIWKQNTPLCQAQICISTGTLFPLLLWHFPHQFFPFHFVLSENNLKNGECLFFAAEIQASLWFDREFRAETMQSAIQKLTLWQWEVTSRTHVPPNTENWAYSALENNNTAKHVRQYLWSYLFFNNTHITHLLGKYLLLFSRQAAPSSVWRV